MTPPTLVRVLLRLVGIASLLAPRIHRARLREQWEAELLHRWRIAELKAGDSPRGPRSFSAWEIFRWTLGPFQHAWCLLREEHSLDSLWMDVRHGFRSLNRSRGLIAMAVLSVAIGIGANTTIFGMVDVFMFKPLPYPDADRLLVVWETNAARGIERWRLSIPNFVDLKARTRTMEVAGVMDETFNLSGDYEAERLRGNIVTPGFFRVLGVSPARGRGFTEEEGAPGRNRVAVISHGLWQRRFGSDPEIPGRSIVLDGATYTLVGVMPAGFWFESPGIDVWVAGAPTGAERRDEHVLGVLGRVRDGSTVKQASAEAVSVIGALAAENPETSVGNGGRVETLHDALFDSGFKAASAISMAAVFLVLLIACANVASLLLAQATRRGGEVALRRALGAARSRITRRFLIEALLVAGLGGILGLGFSVAGTRGLVAVLPADIPRVDEVTLSPRVLLFAGVVSVLTALLCGMAPALRSGRADLTGSFQGRAGRQGRRERRAREALVVMEVALALVLLVSSTLLFRGFTRVRLRDMGLDRSDVLVMRTQLPENQYPDTASVGQFYVELAARIRSIPGVVEVGGTNIFPGQGRRVVYYVPGKGDIDDPAVREYAAHRYVLPGYLDALDIPVVSGRSFRATDRIGASRVAVVSESLVRRDWPGQDPIGRSITGSSGSWEIVGVVADTWNPGLRDEPPEMIYFCALQTLVPFMDWAVEASVPLATLANPLRAAVRSVDPTIPAFDVMSLDALVDQGLGRSLVMAKVMGVVALLALVLALGGIHGIVAYSVSQRTHELGVRMSLGARRTTVLRMFVGHGTRMALLGISAGMVMALIATRGLSHFLFGVSPFDPPTFVIASLVLLGAVAAATVAPALRATKVDPVEALRVE